MFGRREAPAKQEKPKSEPPKDALAALMEGNTPDKKDLRFADERSESFDYPRSKESNQRQSKSGGHFEQYNGDHSFDHRPNSAQGEYEYRPQDNSTINSRTIQQSYWTLHDAHHNDCTRACLPYSMSSAASVKSPCAPDAWPHSEGKIPNKAF